MCRRPPSSRLFPYTTLFRSAQRAGERQDLEPARHALHLGVEHEANTARGFKSALRSRSEEHTSELQSRQYLVCRLLLEKKKKQDLIQQFAAPHHCATGRATL